MMETLAGLQGVFDFAAEGASKSYVSDQACAMQGWATLTACEEAMPSVTAWGAGPGKTARGDSTRRCLARCLAAEKGILASMRNDVHSQLADHVQPLHQLAEVVALNIAQCEEQREAVAVVFEGKVRAE